MQLVPSARAFGSKREMKGPAPVKPARVLPSVFRRQQDRAVGEIELDLVDRKIRERDLLRIDDVVIAVVANEGCSPVGIDLQFPDLESFTSNGFLKALRDGIQKPIGSAFVGDVFRAVGEDNVAVEAVPVPVFGAGELAENCFAE